MPERAVYLILKEYFERSGQIFDLWDDLNRFSWKKRSSIKNSLFCHMMDILNDLWQAALHFWLSGTEAPHVGSPSPWLPGQASSLFIWVYSSSLAPPPEGWQRKGEESKMKSLLLLFNDPWKERIMNEIETNGKNKLLDFLCFLLSLPSFISTDNQ